MYSTRLTMDTVYTGEQCIDITPKFRELASMPGVGFVHGAGSNADYTLADFGQQDRKTQRVGSIYPAVVGDNGGQQAWGNSTAIARLDGYMSRLKARTDAHPTKYALIGDSMGGLTALNYAAQAPVKPLCMILTIPVINLNDVVVNNRGSFTTTVNAAYGGTYTEASMGAAYNPYTMKDAAKLQGIPMLIFYGATDAICIPSYTEGFAASDPTHRTLVISPGTGHEEATYSFANAQLDRMETFLRTYLV